MRFLPSFSIMIIVILLTSCEFLDRNPGMFGHSRTKEEASKYGSSISLYIPDKYRFQLLDGTILTTDTVWTEVCFTYKNGKRDLDSIWGFHFSIPFQKAIPESFTFTFSLLDTINQSFTNGIDENLCQLCPYILKDEIKVLLEQKDTTSKGWANPILTDTITYRRFIK